MVGICFLLIQVCFSEISLSGEKGAEDISHSDDYLSMSLEELMNVEIITASRKSQKISESPIAVSVITAEDIKRSGMTNIPDILRRVPGVDVASLTSSGYAVTTRRLNERYSNKMLAMIDGRLINKPFLGHTLWQNIPVQLEEIERIEIIRGPGSILYGANAFAGIINIITKSPEDLKGTFVEAGVGNLDTYRGTLIHAGKIEKLNYKISLGWEQGDNWEDLWDGRHRDTTRADFRGEYELGADKKVKFQAGLIEGNYQVICMHGGSYVDIDPGDSYYQVEYNQPNFHVRTYRNSTRQWETTVPTGKKRKMYGDLNHLELQHSFASGKYHNFVWGGNISQDKVDQTIIDEKRSYDLWAVYFEDQIKLGDAFTLALGGRYDDHSVFDNHFTPRTSLIYQFRKNHSFRLSYSTAFRNPSFVELYRQIDKKQGTKTIKKRGNDSLEPEEVNSFELGYYGLLSKRLNVGASLFYNEAEHLIEEYLSDK